MAVAITQATILADFIRQFGLGRAGTTTANGNTSTLTDSTNFAGPFAGGIFPNGSPIRVTSGTAVGSNTYRTALNTTTGAITVSPAMSGTPGTGATFIISNVVDHNDRIIEAMNRALQRRCSRWVKVPLTDIPDGDFLSAVAGGVVSDHWASTNATLAYINLTMANGYAQTCIQVTTTSANGYAQSDAIPVEPLETRMIAVMMRNANSSATTVNTAQLVIQDLTNNAAITPTFSLNSATTTSHGWVQASASYVVPSGCSQVAWRLQGQENNAVVQFGNCIDVGSNQRNFTTQPHLRAWEDISAWYVAVFGPTSTTMPEDTSWQNQSSQGVSWQNYGWGYGVEWDSIPTFPTFYDEFMFFPTLTSDAATTNCDEELLMAAMALELFEMLVEQNKQNQVSRYGRHIPTHWELALDRAHQRWNSGRIQRLLAQRRVVLQRNYGRRLYA